MDSGVALFNEKFERLHYNSRALIQLVPLEVIYKQPRESIGGTQVYSCGELVLRSAATVEQTFGGITTNLWDDPFEWTLPETLSTGDRIIEYLDEVEATRQRGFALFSNDDLLMKEIVVPSGEMRTILYLLLDTLVRAAHHQGRAFATFRLFSDAKFPRI